jgi:16S rRNA (uracil1498-N3)-methyltransferase
MKQEKLHWFLLDKEPFILENNQFTFTHVQLLHQFNRVLKFKQGEKLVLFNGKGTYIKCEIVSLSKKECVCDVIGKETVERDSLKETNLFFAIPKKNKFELIIEKGTEIGVSSFTPINTDRTEKLNIKKDRAKKILIEASEQSENPYLPQLEDVSGLSEVIQKINPKNTFVFHTKGETLDVCDLKFFSETNILIGPEGGWSDRELEMFKDKKIRVVKVGDSVLKTETACIVIPFLFRI